MKQSILLKLRTFHTKNELISELLSAGYYTCEEVLQPGCFNFHGDVLRLWPTDYDQMITIDFFGDEIERIWLAGQDSSKQEIAEVTLLPNILHLDDGGIAKRNDYLVHEDHGIGMFDGITIKEVDGEKIRYIRLLYLNNDILYVPFSQLDKLSIYIGVGRKRVKLSKLGSVVWKKTYHKTYENALKMAKEMLILHAQRELVNKTPKKNHPDWNDSISKTFGFIETEDQKKAINDVYKDLACKTPMDRLICGDVGFGKTEVAIRAAAQAIANGFQVAFLVPTTILCEQHYENLVERFANLPVNIRKLSRFVALRDQIDTLKEIGGGKVDLLISTHAILRRQIKYKNLGLLIIDEEQKFGAKDKEMIKSLRRDLDVLVMSATPIPRTLFMSLSGIRDISQISEPPVGRQAVETEVARYDSKLINKYIDRELARSGQVYYLHNEVSTILGIRKQLERQYPEKIVEVGHGQMSEDKLASVMRNFVHGKIDILVCSTIIENGIDLPNANTLVVEDADRFGLSQLYQIRGRIGRSKKQAFALFTFKNKELTNNAMKRLKSLTENTELGSGFNIAMSDLEIRGGGNILGREQHGNMEAVGLVLYSKLLKLAVERLKGGE